MEYARKRIAMSLCLALLAGLAGLSPARADDAWMSKIALSELKLAADSGEFDALEKRVKGAILGRLSTGKIKNLDAMVDMIYVLRACQYGNVAMEIKFERTEAKAKVAARDGLFKDGKAMFKWLIANRGVSRVLFRGMQDLEDPKEALLAVAELKELGDRALLAYSELTTAFATSRAGRAYQDQLNPASITDAFKYYTTRKMRYDLKKMPYELSRYLADSDLSIKERQWAYGKYNRQSNPARAYFDLKYDTEHLEQGTPKKISRLPFTLPNLLKVGGVCIEQAYYSSEVCKAVGIPAKIVTGRSGGGIRHAWMMSFVRMPRGRSASWDSSTGRYASQKYFVGNVQNPATGQNILDCELALEGAAALLPPARREDADAATALAVLTAEVANAGELADLTDLKALAELYKKRFEKSPVDPESLKAKIKIDMAIVEDFLAMALSYNIAHKPAWDFIIELRSSRDMLEVSHLGRFFDVLTSKTAKAYPDYSCEMVMRIVPSIPEPSSRMKIYQKAMSVYSARRDLQGRIMIVCGDDCAERDKPALALKFYETAALKNVDLANIVTEASGKAEKLLLAADSVKGGNAAIAMYAKLFKASKKPRKVASGFAGQNSYNILGTRLATLLESAGRGKEAQKIRKMIQ
jgi:hypothetical protein